jgi:pilus assembly protein CpaB
VRADGVPRDAVATPEDLKGKVALVTMTPGQMITSREVASRGPELGLAYAVKPPLRAVTVALDPIIGVAGFPKPGNHVDVLATFTTDRVGTVTRTVLQDVEILALGSEVQAKQVDPSSGKTSEAKPTIPTATLAVLPGEAEKLILAENRGKLRLALRGVDDKTFASRTKTIEATVVGVAPTPKDAPPTTVTKTVAAPESKSTREEHYYQSETRSLPPAPSLPPVSYSPIAVAAPPRPERFHDIAVIKGTEKQIVRFKQSGRAKIDTTAPVDVSPESN